MGNRKRHSGLELAIKHFGSQQKLIDAVEMLSQQSLSRYLNCVIEVPPKLAIAIETATIGAITRQMMRPDLWPPQDALPYHSPQAHAGRGPVQDRKGPDASAVGDRATSCAAQSGQAVTTSGGARDEGGVRAVLMSTPPASVRSSRRRKVAA